MKLSQHFTLEELTFSQTASRLSINNEPGQEELGNLKGLANFLEVIRMKIGEPIFVSSGFRSERLNDKIGGSRTSAHMEGRAADIVAPNFGTPRELAELIVALDLEFDQVILEFDRWVHVAVAEKPRHEILTAQHGLRGTEYIVGLV